jgi:signal transduction histidine kinase
VQPSGIESWQRTLPGWDVYFALVAAGTMLLAVDWQAALVILAMVVWYLLLGRKVMRGDHSIPSGALYITGAGALLIAALLLDGGSSFILFALSAQAHMALGFRWGTVATLILNLLPAVIHPSGPALMIGLAAIVLTTVIGFSIDRLVEQSMALAASRAEVARLSQEAERQRLGADLHDTLAQGLSSVVMLTQAAEAALDRDPGEARRHLDLATRTARDNLLEIRAVLDALMPAGENLPTALRRVAPALTLHGTPRPLPLPVEVVLLRAAQESLANARNHAHASTVTVDLSYTDDSVRLTTTDNGKGFNPSETFSGYGIPAMKSRVTQAGGTVGLTSTAQGTTVTVEIPA